MHHVFVYGTLKRGHPNAHIGMPRATFLGDYRTSERYPLIIGNEAYVPNLINEPGTGFQVTGELYEVDDSVLAELDQLESIHLPNGYRRLAIAIEPIKAVGAPLDRAWTYLRERRHIKIIHDGPMATYPLDRRYSPAAD
jgi:gamma-glutamylaminecyclotransferase